MKVIYFNNCLLSDELHYIIIKTIREKYEFYLKSKTAILTVIMN